MKRGGYVHYSLKPTASCTATAHALEKIGAVETVVAEEAEVEALEATPTEEPQVGNLPFLLEQSLSIQRHLSVGPDSKIHPAVLRLFPDQIQFREAPPWEVG